MFGSLPSQQNSSSVTSSFPGAGHTDLRYKFDVLNRMTNMVDSVGTTRFAYDIAGRLLLEDGPWSSDTVSYTYTNGLRWTLVLQQPSGWISSKKEAVDRREGGVVSSSHMKFALNLRLSLLALLISRKADGV